MVRELRWVALSDIPLLTDVREWRQPSDGFAIGGDWDRTHVASRPSIFEASQGSTVKDTIHDTVRAIFLHGKPYRSTAQFDYMMKAVKEDRFELAYGCKSEEEVDAYFRRLIRAHQAMSEHGYLTQAQMNGPPADEIKLYVTREGTWCHGNGGNHRIRLAELVGMQSVPVYMAGAHHEFVYRTSTEEHKPPRSAMLAWFRNRSTDSP